MSLDIDWTLLTPSTLSSNLVNLLNTHLSTAPRPSFIGPITVTAFDFGTVPPDVEIKDIRDVWRAFDEGDDEGDQAEGTASHSNSRSRSARANSNGPVSSLDDESYEVISPSDVHRYYEEESGMDDGTMSVYSGLGSPRQSIAAVGLGSASAAAMQFGMSRDSIIYSQRNGTGNGYGYGRGRSPSMFSFPHQSQSHSGPPPSYNNYQHQNQHHQQHHYGSRRPKSSQVPFRTPPPSPPAHPGGLPPSAHSTSSIPSLQLHLRFSHSSDLTLTLLTSLSVNYPSPSFMSLPLKLSITGLTLSGDVIIAYSGEKNRVHLCVVDDDSNASGAGDSSIPIGQKLLPNLTIESEIGHADAHVLRNVGKVERFIADVVRKTLVDELVFPNFQTIAL